MKPIVYIIGSLRDERIVQLGKRLREEAGVEVFDDWHAAGPIADDSWQKYETLRGRSYKEALRGYAANHVFNFDHHHLRRATHVVLVMPAGKSGHLELGFAVGQGKKAYVLFPEKYEESCGALPLDWVWLAGLYEGEGCVTNNKAQSRESAFSHQAAQLSISMKDEDVIDKVVKVAGRGRKQGPYVHRKNKPAHAPMYRWSVYKREDILYVLKGMWPFLGARRKAQAIARGFSEAEILDTKGPTTFRFDQMYQFVFETGGDVFFNDDELIKELEWEGH